MGSEPQARGLRPPIHPTSSTSIPRRAFLAALATTAAACGDCAPTPGVPNSGATLEQLSQAIRDGAHYLSQVCQSDGSFTYRLALDDRFPPKPSYNMLRHAGAMYAMAQVCQSEANGQATRDALRRAAKYLLERVEHVEDDDPSQSCVWSAKDSNEAKLGGAGLSLIALTETNRVMANTASLEPLQGLAAFVRAMQKSDGSFYSKYHRSSGPDDSWTSLYYPGEAALGMLLLHRTERDLRNWDCAKNALLFLANSRKGRTEVEPDHWALLATRELIAQDDQRSTLSKSERAQIIEHATQVAAFIANDRPKSKVAKALIGCFDRDGKTTPTATRVEGLVAFLGLPQKEIETALRAEVHALVGPSVRFLASAQVRHGALRGAVPRAIQPRADEAEDSPFNRRVSEVRIDYVQHCVSAWLGALELAKTG